MKTPPIDAKSGAPHNDVRATKALIFGDFTEIRCEKCSGLLFRQLNKSNDPPNRVVEIKCRKCGTLNRV